MGKGARVSGLLNGRVMRRKWCTDRVKDIATRRMSIDIRNGNGNGNMRGVRGGFEVVNGSRILVESMFCRYPESQFQRGALFDAADWPSRFLKATTQKPSTLPLEPLRA